MSSLARNQGPVSRTFNLFGQALIAGVGRLDKSFSPSLTISRLKQHKFTFSDSIYIFHIIQATFWLSIMQVPDFPLKLAIPALYTLALLIPFTSQFFIPATPVFAWLLTYYTSRFIPTPWRPTISVSLLPTLESVLYGANISDILTRFTHPVLDIIAWLPYGVIHFTFPFFVAAFLWLFRQKETLHLWARTFGYMNLAGVVIQIIFPCSPPWYEVIYGLTPANYSMKGSPGGLLRIDTLFHSSGYSVTFSNSPLVFGAFPSLHAGNATLEALFLAHFFPWSTRYIWAYAGVLYWSTMYLTHHYLIDVVGGACLATAFFYLYLPDELRGTAALLPPVSPQASQQRNKYDVYDLEDPRRGHGLDTSDFELSETSSDDEERADIAYRSPITNSPMSTKPFVKPDVDRDIERTALQVAGTGRKNHRHTASIASLIRGDERSPEDGWSPVTAGFVFPPGGKSASRGE